MTTRTIPGIVAVGLLVGCGAGAPPAEAPLAERTALRTSPPPPLPARPIEFPPFRETVLPNGLRLVVLEEHEQPVVNVDLYVESGSADDPAPEAGLAGIAAEMLTKGTPERTAEEISGTIEGVGGDLGASATEDYIRVGATVLSDQLPLAFDLISDVALRPTFPAGELEIVRTRALSALQAELSEPGALAERRFLREVYGERHPYSLAPSPQTLAAIDREGLERFHRRHFRADNALLVVSGDVEAARVEELVRRHFGGWEGGGAPEPAFVEPPARDRAHIYFVHRPGSVQSTLRVGHTAIRPDSPDYYPLQVLNKVLGGGADARLFLVLREQKGWTYGAYSDLSEPEDIGYFSAAAEVRNEVTDSALVEILDQLRRLREEPVPAEELEAAKSYLVGSFPLRLETPRQIARQVAHNLLLGRPVEALTGYRERIGAVTAADVQRVARQYVRPDRAAIVVVGDATRVLDAVDDIAPVTLFSAEGELLDRATLQPAR